MCHVISAKQVAVKTDHAEGHRPKVPCDESRTDGGPAAVPPTAALRLSPRAGKAGKPPWQGQASRQGGVTADSSPSVGGDGGAAWVAHRRGARPRPGHGSPGRCPPAEAGRRRLRSWARHSSPRAVRGRVCEVVKGSNPNPAAADSAHQNSSSWRNGLPLTCVPLRGESTYIYPASTNPRGCRLAESPPASCVM